MFVNDMMIKVFVLVLKVVFCCNVLFVGDSIIVYDCVDVLVVVSLFDGLIMLIVEYVESRSFLDILMMMLVFVVKVC